MNIEITSENLLIQLGYPISPATTKQMEEIIVNTNGFDKFSKHLLSLHDDIRYLNGYIAMSNSSKYLKIKTDSSGTEELEAFSNILGKWSKKYKVTLQKVEGKNTFYIIGLS